jgi:hypothetical protein
MNNRKTFSRMRTGLMPRRFRPGIFLGRAASSRRYVARYRIEAIAMRRLARWRSAVSGEPLAPSFSGRLRLGIAVPSSHPN